MTRRPAVFTQADVTKVVKGAMAAGLEIARVEVDHTGKVVAIVGKPGDDTPVTNEWDVVLNAQEKRAS